MNYGTEGKLHGVVCSLCGSPKARVFFEMKNMPASCNMLWSSKEDALNCPKGDIKLVFCPFCTYVSNASIEPEKNQYDNRYDSSLFYSVHFQEFARKLATSIVKRFSLYNKNIVEIGGGKVDFLSLLVELGQNCGFRFDPFHSKIEDVDHKKDISLNLDSKFFPFLTEGKKVDFVFSYHELEHMNDPENFLKNLRKLLDQSVSARVFLSVPNSLKTFEEGDFSEIIYEHVSYFTTSSLYFLLLSCGFDISSFEETKGEIFDSIYVFATLKQGKMLPNLKPNSEFEAIQIEKCIQRFAAKTIENIGTLSRKLTKLLDDGNRIVVWGVGSRGVTFLNIFKDQRIEYAVDINPYKHGMFVPGTGQRIVKPEFLVKYKPDIILLANPSYKEEIKHIIDGLKIKVEFISI